MKKALFLLILIINMITVSAQSGFNYYKDSIKNGSTNEKAFAYFKKAYYDCIWKWTTAGADSAEYYLKLAIQEDSNYTAAYAFLAHVYQFKTYNPQDFDKYFVLEKKYAEKAVSFNPQTGDAYSVMADVAWTEHDTVKALSLLRNAIAREPDNVGNYLWISVRFTQMGMADDSAVYYLHRLLQYDPEYGQAFMKLGNIYNWNKHDFASAKFYYRKAIEHYNTIKPRDNRMMGGYYSLADVYYKEQKYDSATYYYKIYLQELEPSDMYVRDQFLSLTYKALYECHQRLSGFYLNEFLILNEQRIAKDSNNINLLLETLEQNYMSIELDSVYEKYALPLARHIQKIHTTDPYINTYAVDDEFLILKQLKRNDEAIKVLELYYAKNPREPLILFELALEKILANNKAEGFAYLNKTKQNLNAVFTKEVFIQQLNNPDFDKVRDTPEFKKLKE
jgi:Tfp pilus assembly protein PilF